VILTSPAARAVLKDLTRADLPRLVVLSQREIPRDTPVEVLGSVVEEEAEAVTTYTTISQSLVVSSLS
jgi:flagellar biosynthesis protein FlhA